MCGILGWWQPSGSADRAAFESALALQGHRGPDDRGVECFPDLWLGHNRLAILDLSARGHQPMHDAAGRYCMVYNGEVYNYPELRTELEDHGRTFATGTDTEVVLQAFAQWGEEAFARFNGMWALAIWDRRQRTLTLSRDRFGVKPLYLRHDHSGLWFASELKPLLALDRHSPRPALGAIARFLVDGNVDGQTDTWFEGIQRFPPGSLLSVQAQAPQRLRWSRYWELPRPGEGAPPDREAFAMLVEDAVRISLRADVPVGTCLSGGVDSSTVACLASRHQPVRTFTARHPDAGSDEFRFVEMLAARIPIVTSEAWTDSEQVFADAAQILWHLEEPAKATGVLSQWQVMRVAREHVTVLLDGQGGDEAFGGYDFHRGPFLRGLLARGRVADFVREAAAWGWRRVAAIAFDGVQRRSRRALRPLLRPLIVRLRGERSPWTRWFLDTYLDSALRRTREPSLGCLHQRLAWDLGEEMLPALLRYEDRLSMAFSLESRVPLLDHRVVESAFAMRDVDLVRDGYGKYPLRSVLARNAPAAIAWRRDKQGFPTPFNSYLAPHRRTMEGWMRDGAMVRAGIVDGERAAAALAADLANPHGRLAWHLLQIEWWLRNFIEGDFRRPLNWVSP